MNSAAEGNAMDDMQAIGISKEAEGRIVDAHCHIYPGAIAERAAAAIGRFYDVPMLFDGQVETLLGEGAQAGISRFVVSSVATKPHQVQAVNTFIASQVSAHPNRLAGLGTLHPDSPDMEGDIALLKSLGLKGVKVHPDMLGIPIDDPRFMRMFALCEGQLPVLCHFGDKRFDLTNPNRTATVLKAFPRLTIIGAHLGGWSVWREAAEALSQYKNLLTDCSSSLFALPPQEAASLIRRYGAERVLFGTDYPMWRAEEELARFAMLPLSEPERQAILWVNATRLYGICW